MDAKEMTLIATELLDEKKALEVCSIDIADKSGFADYFVMATGMNTRHLTSLADDLEERFAKENVFLRQGIVATCSRRNLNKTPTFALAGQWQRYKPGDCAQC